jgi:hypothetical protein
MATNPTRTILPKECDGYRFGVGHEVSGLKYVKALSDSHLPQHLAVLAMLVPTTASYMAKATVQNNAPPQISRALRDREEQEDLWLDWATIQFRFYQHCQTYNGSFCVFGPVLSSPAHGPTYLALGQVEIEIVFVL